MARYLAFGAAAVIMLVGVVWFFLPLEYEAFALLKVAEKPGQVLDKSSDGAAAFDIFKRTQVQLIKSGVVLRWTVADPKIQKLSLIREHDDQVAWLRDHLLVDYPDDSEIMRVAIRGEKPDELMAIVDEVVKKYLSEVVQREREIRLQQEGMLDTKYNEYVNEFTDQAEALHKLEQLEKISGSASAEIRRKLALAQLDEAIATRDYLKRLLVDNAIQIMLMEAREQTSSGTSKSDAGSAIKNTAASDLTLPLLEKQKAYLEARLAIAEKEIEEQANGFERLESFSASVTAKREELEALKEIKNRLKAQLDRTEVERLARERITKVDDASLASTGGDMARKYAGLSAAAVVSFVLLVFGLVAGRPRQS